MRISMATSRLNVVPLASGWPDSKKSIAGGNASCGGSMTASGSDKISRSSNIVSGRSAVTTPRVRETRADQSAMRPEAGRRELASTALMENVSGSRSLSGQTRARMNVPRSVLSLMM